MVVEGDLPLCSLSNLLKDFRGILTTLTTAGCNYFQFLVFSVCVGALQCTGWCLLHYSAHSTNAVMFSCQALTGWSEFILYCTVVSLLVFVIFIQETMASMTVQSASLLPEGIHHILSHQFPALSWLRHTLLFDARANPNDPVPCWFPHRSNESNESNRVNLF